MKTRFATACLHLAVLGLVCACGSMPAGAAPLEALDQAYIQEITRNTQTFSHKEGLVNSIERLLDCSAAGRIDVALIGLSEVPEWVHRLWARHQENVQEVSISRYSLALDAKNPQIRTDFYRFRTTQDDARVVEMLLQDIHKDQKAAIIFRFVNGDPTGPDQNLAAVLEDLLSVVEEGQIGVAAVPFADIPARVHSLWRIHAQKGGDGQGVTVQKFTANSAGGDLIFWRLSFVEPEGGFEQTLLVHRNALVFNNVDGQVLTR